MKEDKIDIDRSTAEAGVPTKKGRVRRLLDWLAEGTRKSLKNGTGCPT